MATVSTGALSGTRVLDLTQMLAGPYAAMMLADHGAEVVKIEAPAGDMSRSFGPFASDDLDRTHGGYFQSVNRNKLSVCLDLKDGLGRDAFLSMVSQSDVVIENFRAGVMDRLGLGYERLREVNPRLVYGAIRGFGDGRTGASPYVDWPAFDVVAQAVGGIMGLTGPARDSPTKVGPGVGDLIPGAMLAFGILAALLHASRTGEGQFVDVAMTDATLAICERAVYQFSVEGRVPGPEGNHHPLLCPFGMFPASDGFVTIGAHQDSFFKVLCERLGAPGLLCDARFGSQALRARHRVELIAALSALTGARTKAELSALLGARIPFGAVNTIAEIVSDPHFSAREMVVDLPQPGRERPIQVAGVPVKLARSPGAVRTRAPYLGEHTEPFLRRSGLADSEIAHLLGTGAAIQHMTPETPA